MIGDLIAAIRRRIVPVGIWVALCVGAGLGYASIVQAEFVANAQIALEPRVRLPPGADAAAAAAAATPVLDSSQAESQVQVIRSSRNLRYVFDVLKLDTDPTFAYKGPGFLGRIKRTLFVDGQEVSSDEEATRAREIAFQNFSDSVQVRRLGQSYVLEVSFRGPNPSSTARIANSIAAAYIRDQVLFHAVSEQRGVEFLQGRISLIQAEKKAADEAVATGVITDFQFPDSDARIVGSALTPLAASYPQTKLILILALALGLLSSIGAIIILHNFDRIVRSPSQIRRALGVNCMVVVPRVRYLRLAGDTVLSNPDSDFAATIRLLRTVLFSKGNKTQPFSVGMLACEDGEGCTTLCSNLAYLMAASNSRILLVDANLPKPDLTHSLSPSAPFGLADVGSSSAKSVDLPHVELSQAFRFVPAIGGGRIANPNFSLSNQSLQEGLARLSVGRDVIFDLPSLASSSEAQAVGHLLNGVVLVASRDKTKLNALVEAVRALRLAEIRVLGVILNDARVRDRRRSIS